MAVIRYFDTKEQRAKSREFGYQRRAPCCRSCAHAGEPIWGQAEFGEAYVPPRCGLGGFVISMKSVCGKWAKAEKVLEPLALAA